MRKKDIVYLKLRDRVKESFTWSADSKLLDEITNYIIELTKLDILVDALRFINKSRYWDYAYEDELALEHLRILQDEAEDALLELYKDE